MNTQTSLVAEQIRLQQWADQIRDCQNRPSDMKVDAWCGEQSAMLNDASGFQKIYLATEYTDFRRGMEGLANIIRFHFHLDPYDRNTLFLFCGKRTDRIKGPFWEGDGFLLLYKRLDTGAFNWPRSKEEALAITPEQYSMLMQGLEIIARHPIEQTTDPKKLF